MHKSTISDLVATQLSELWQFHRTPEFLDYLFAVYKMKVEANPTFERIYIAGRDKRDIQDCC